MTIPIELNGSLGRGQVKNVQREIRNNKVTCAAKAVITDSMEIEHTRVTGMAPRVFTPPPSSSSLLSCSFCLTTRATISQTRDSSVSTEEIWKGVRAAKVTTVRRVMYRTG